MGSSPPLDLQRWDYISGAKSCYSLCVTLAQGLVQLLNRLGISGCFVSRNSTGKVIDWTVSISLVEVDVRQRLISKAKT